MNFDLTEDQAMLKAAVERFVADSYGGDLAARRRARQSPAGFSAVHWARLAALTPVVALARLGAAAEMLGLMTLLFDTTLAYVKTRTQFGQALGAFQIIQHRMADAYVRVEQARSQVVRAALAPDAAFARAAAGGMGITDALVVGHALKRIRVLALTSGDANAALDDYRCAA